MRGEGKKASTKSTLRPTYLEQLFDKSDTAVGKEQFEILCLAGCDREVLGGLLVLISAKTPICLEADEKKGRKKAYEILVHPLDTWERAANGISRDDLNHIASSAARLQADINRLRNTPLVRQLIAQRILPVADLLCGPAITGILDPRFEGIMLLPEIAKQYGPRSRPEHTRLLKKIYGHIKNKTGNWHDEKLAYILDSLLPHSPDQFSTGQNLKQWRYRHGLTG